MIGNDRDKAARSERFCNKSIISAGTVFPGAAIEENPDRCAGRLTVRRVDVELITRRIALIYSGRFLVAVVADSKVSSEIGEQAASAIIKGKSSASVVY